MNIDATAKTKTLIERGVDIRHPASVDLGADVDLDRIAPGCIIHAGCRIHGPETAIAPHAEIGAESPATVINCQLGNGVRLKGGYFEESTFLDGSSMGSGAHVRAGTLLEEQASGAHSVGLKQTVLLPFATLGSLVNFCDCLMAGGTGRRNHSEVGSSYIHFNFTPHGDKATPSLIGDVPRGVMLDQKPIFLGGQGGLVGPTRIEFGVVIPAGVIWRKDALSPAKIHIPATSKAGSYAYTQGLYRSIARILHNNLLYIGNIFALKCWYSHVRSVNLKDDHQRYCRQGALKRLDSILAERLARLTQLADKMEYSLATAKAMAGVDGGAEIYRQQLSFQREWPALRPRIENMLQAAELDENGRVFVEQWCKDCASSNYIDAVRALSEDTRKVGSVWLQACAERFVRLASLS